jgi:hypothetical protein
MRFTLYQNWTKDLIHGTCTKLNYTRLRGSISRLFRNIAYFSNFFKDRNVALTEATEGRSVLMLSLLVAP